MFLRIPWLSPQYEERFLAIFNHLLDSNVPRNDDTRDDRDEGDEMDVEGKLPTITFTSL